MTESEIAAWESRLVEFLTRLFVERCHRDETDSEDSRQAWDELGTAGLSLLSLHGLERLYDALGAGRDELAGRGSQEPVLRLDRVRDRVWTRISVLRDASSPLSTSERCAHVRYALRYLAAGRGRLAEMDPD